MAHRVSCSRTERLLTSFRVLQLKYGSVSSRVHSRYDQELHHARVEKL